MLTYFDIDDRMKQIHSDTCFSSSLTDITSHPLFIELANSNEYDLRTIKLYLIFKMFTRNNETNWHHILLAAELCSRQNEFEYPPKEYAGKYHLTGSYYLNSLIGSEANGTT